MPDDHPNPGRAALHVQCTVNHHGRDIPDHCRCGARWPCPVKQRDPDCPNCQTQEPGSLGWPCREHYEGNLREVLKSPVIQVDWTP